MYSSFIKRILDVIASVLLLLLFSWLGIGIALGYLITFNFPMLFKQQRIGKDNQPFLIYKFRTLHVSESIPLMDRRFWWGDVLRFLSLDELPQLWNVLRGEMSMIGPRPLPLEYLSLMDKQQRSRHAVKPGITGLTQVSGRNEISWKKKFEMDSYYVKHLSWRLDLAILLKTVSLLVSFQKDRSLSEKKFEGASSFH